jgi:hypothetical protein
MHFLQRYLFVAAVALVIAAVPSPSPAQATMQLETTGVVRPLADAQPHDLDEAMAIALRSALVEAGQKKATLTPPAQRLLQAAVDKLDVAGLDPYFASRQIVQERKRRGYYEVKLASAVKLAELQKLLDAAAKNESPLKKMRVMIVIPEHHLARPIPDPAGETEMIRLFIRDGFRVIDQKQVETIRDKDLVKRAAKDDPKELVAIAQGWGAELLLVGEAFSQDVPVDRSLVGNSAGCRARIEARVIQCDTGDILTANDGEGGAVDLSPAVAAKAALRTAAGKMAEKMLADLLVNGHGQASRGRVRIVLAGADFESKLLFRKMLEGMKEIVAEAEEVSFQESRAEIDVVTSVTAGKLAEEVFLKARGEGMKLKVLEQSGRRCVIEVVGGATPASAPAPRS